MLKHIYYILCLIFPAGSAAASGAGLLPREKQRMPSDNFTVQGALPEAAKRVRATMHIFRHVHAKHEVLLQPLRLPAHVVHGRMRCSQAVMVGRDDDVFSADV